MIKCKIEIYEDLDRFKMALQGKKPEWEWEYYENIFQKRIGVHIRHVMIIDDEGKVLYDRILFGIRGGGIFVPVNEEGKVGLIKIWRPQTRDKEKYEKEFPNYDLKDIGQWSWEVPRGLIHEGEVQENAVLREVREETGAAVQKWHTLPDVNDSTGFNVHMAPVLYGTLDMNAKVEDQVDKRELIDGKIRFFSLAELNQLRKEAVDDAKLYCLITLGAIKAVELDHPDLIR